MVSPAYDKTLGIDLVDLSSAPLQNMILIGYIMKVM